MDMHHQRPIISDITTATRGLRTASPPGTARTDGGAAPSVMTMPEERKRNSVGNSSGM